MSNQNQKPNPKQPNQDDKSPGQQQQDGGRQGKSSRDREPGKPKQGHRDQQGGGH